MLCVDLFCIELTHFDLEYVITFFLFFLPDLLSSTIVNHKEKDTGKYNTFVVFQMYFKKFVEELNHLV